MVTLSGSDFLTTVTAKASPATVAERILQTLPVTPSGYPGTRITQLSQLWERYRFVRFAFRYVPAVPVTVACQFALYVDTDPLDDPTVITNADTLVRQAVAQTGAQQWNFNLPKTVELARRGDDQLYYTGEDKQNLRFSQQGTGYLIQVTEPVGIDGSPATADLVAGSIFIDWSVVFQTPQINPESDIAIPFALETGETDITGQTLAGPISISPAIPGELYIISLKGLGAPSTTSSIELEALEPPGAGSPIGFTINFGAATSSINTNLTGLAVFPGYMIVQATAAGTLDIAVQKTYDDETNTTILSSLLYNRKDVFATSLTASVFSKEGLLPRTKAVITEE
mgnify:FL=1